MLIVCFCQSCRCYRYLQQEKSTFSPPIRGVRNEKKLSKTASVTDPAALLSPTSHHHFWNTTREKTSSRTPYYSSYYHRWDMSRRRKLSDEIVYHRHTRSAQMSRAAAAIVFRAPALHAALKSRREDRKEESDNQIVVVEYCSVEPLYIYTSGASPPFSLRSPTPVRSHNSF